MKKYKVCVYAICKNEEKFVERWMNSIKEADEIFVLDTGSTDHSVKKLKKLGAKVKTKKIKPWRFDVARNESLKMIPEDYDICICMDLDEVILPGWRLELEKIWKPETTRLKYNYNWSLDEDDQPIVNFYIDKIHSRKHYQWTHPVHEVLTYTKEKEVFEWTDQITINHYPDSQKSRSNYLPLLELSVKEDPNDDRNMHYLGREYMYYGRFQECIDTLIKHLNLKTATWKDERAASMRFIARSYQKLQRFEEAKMWLNKAIKEAPYLRDAYIEMALLEYKFKNWNSVIQYCNEALKITDHTKSYINEPFSWDQTVYDLLSLGYFYINKIDLAIENIEKALEMKPNDERLLKNKMIFIEAKKTS